MIHTAGSSLLRRTSVHLGPRGPIIAGAWTQPSAGLPDRLGDSDARRGHRLRGRPGADAPLDLSLERPGMAMDHVWPGEETPGPKLMRDHDSHPGDALWGAICALVGGVTLLWLLFAAFN